MDSRVAYKRLIGPICAAAAVAVGGCGSTAHPRAAATATSTTVAGGAPQATAPSGEPTQATATAATATTATRPAEPAPAFVRTRSAQGELAEAVTAVEAHGYLPVSTATYNPQDALRVLIGRRNTAEGQQEQAFFFLDNRFLGTDASQPSASITVVYTGEGEVTLRYALYKPSDPRCCASGGTAEVRFALNNGRLQPSQPLPPLSARR